MQNVMSEVPLRKAHAAAACTFDSLHDRVCFFLPVNARNPLRSSAGDTKEGNNVRMDVAVLPHGCTFTKVLLSFNSGQIALCKFSVYLSQAAAVKIKSIQL